jgi:putative SOS response-associated peptidase YedK
MCGRYRLSRRKQIIEEHFAASGGEDWEPRYNIAPTQPIPVIRQNPKEPVRELSLVRWADSVMGKGLVRRRQDDRWPTYRLQQTSN